MKSFLSLSSIAIAAALVSVAAQAEPLTRAEVQAELIRARAAGELDFPSREFGLALIAPKKAPSQAAADTSAVKKEPVRAQTSSDVQTARAQK